MWIKEGDVTVKDKSHGTESVRLETKDRQSLEDRFVKHNGNCLSLKNLSWPVFDILLIFSPWKIIRTPIVQNEEIWNFSLVIDILRQYSICSRILFCCGRHCWKRTFSQTRLLEDQIAGHPTKFAVAKHHAGTRRHILFESVSIALKSPYYVQQKSLTPQNLSHNQLTSAMTQNTPAINVEHWHGWSPLEISETYFL